MRVERVPRVAQVPQAKTNFDLARDTRGTYGTRGTFIYNPNFL